MWAVYYSLYTFQAINSYALTGMTLFSKWESGKFCEKAGLYVPSHTLESDNAHAPIFVLKEGDNTQ